MSRLSRHTIPVIALTLISLGFFTDISTAEPKTNATNKKVCAKLGGDFNVEYTGASSCMLYSGETHNCSPSGDCKWVDTRTPGSAPNGPQGGTNNKVIAKDSTPGWNGQYTTVVVRDGRGTSTYTVKQGVEIENGQMILAPNGASYHVWDPELGRQLKAAGVDAAYANPATAKNEYALARDKVVRDRAIAAGKPVPQPTGHRNNDALGNAVPTVRDHRNGTATEVKPGAPPPAAAPGTVSNSPAPDTGPAVRDHRQQAAGSGRQGGVSVTQASRSSGGSSSGSKQQ
ncbi:hypothetical protein QCM77_39895 [Bradyrhizobium sp. SSUT18]|uniref:hypothetical protein n=1 Tax=Bradyrhizobium sp. SSUT18 TaxID=3040602 RepID=UPI00244D0D6C|nr:hypothetical protein [Bradyrhizobium sp. SSUT18]MDH2406016.1 hypothetical protein [Bradyrhizobium sp. SSUT18]